MISNVIGRCSICNGEVVLVKDVNDAGMHVASLPARCTRCGAEEDTRSYNIIPMKPRNFTYQTKGPNTSWSRGGAISPLPAPTRLSNEEWNNEYLTSWPEKVAHNEQ